MSRKILDIDMLLQKVDEEKCQGKRIALAGGCFDLFHVGHLEYLKGAKTYADKLIVGLNSDNSIKDIKGNSPLFSSNDRAEVLSAFKCVDYVFIFDEKTLDKSIELIAPNYFIKGIDYMGKEILERKTVEKMNGQVLLVGDKKKSSSSYLAREIFYEYIKNSESSKLHFRI
ncbi:adenylyltransferase/cytidyltransferase family protein [Paenibacillus sp. KACC 21273]|uniref:adenylyltransferase/cytidyltransferase family protein n=1 Tax=Paenibacillus sp. KACC 21273 TaxID=3025665 RepID=UPI002366B109|nr:adenylyltransferase/cytidyltransferase family protein [Paenibacillus sp. KACC 21273]WDF52849.1 adenylyltransferase/cytidyltransferase family protein [Paenibacillus sp. KACC 21273]